MRFNWIRDRARQNLSRVRFVSGSLNRVDFMTKALPAHTHTPLAPYVVTRSPPSVYNIFFSSVFSYFFLFSWFELRANLPCFLRPIANGCVGVLPARY